MRIKLAFILCLATSACGVSVSTDQNLILEMYGVSTLPDGSEAIEAHSDPVFHKYTLEKVVLISTEGDQVELHATTDLQEFTIVNRNQIIFTKAISGLVGNTYTQLQVQFNAAVTGGRVIDKKVDENGSFTLTNPVATFTGAIVIETGKSLTFYVAAHWRDTVDPDGNLLVPTLVISEP